MQSRETRSPVLPSATCGIIGLCLLLSISSLFGREARPFLRKGRISGCRSATEEHREATGERRGRLACTPRAPGVGGREDVGSHRFFGGKPATGGHRSRAPLDRG